MNRLEATGNIGYLTGTFSNRCLKLKGNFFKNILVGYSVVADVLRAGRL